MKKGEWKMGIRIVEDKLFLMNTNSTTYAFFKDEEEILVHLYWGKKITREKDFNVNTMEGEQGYHPNIDKKREECSSFGCMRYKETSFKITFSDGTRDYRYRVKDFKTEGNHLTIITEDIYYKVQVILHYVVHEELDIIEKWREIRNIGEETIEIERFFSGEFTLPGDSYRTINNNGTWADEFKAYEDTLCAGKKIYESLRGATAHVATPGFIVHKDATERTGQVYFGVLAYSGNFKIVEEQTPYGYLNIQMGISDTDFLWKLKEGENFVSPKIYAGYSDAGFGKMSNILHNFAQECVMPRATADKSLRILYNSWEATAFDVVCEEQMKLAEKAAQLGVELFVVDDGWFGQRYSDHMGLGDWYVNQEKFPKGLKPLIDYVKSLEMDFGIWIEPEMTNENSELFCKHPDWIYRYKNRPVLEGRYQYMLDLTNQDVIHYIVTFIDRLLTENDISYIKWDMNRALGECGSFHLPPEEYNSIWYRHIQGFYSIIEELRKRHPQVEFEACASGGGRVDYGCMERFDEFWISDNTDPLERLSIQENYTLLYPPKYMRAWITDAADGEERKVPLAFKAHCAMCGALGIGMNLNHITEEQEKEMKSYLAEYKEIRPVIQYGRLARLNSCQKGPLHAVQYDKDGEAVLFVFLMLRPRGQYSYYVKLVNLEENALYRVVLDGKEFYKSGAYLMYNGLEFYFSGDFSSKCVRITKMLTEKSEGTLLVLGDSISDDGRYLSFINTYLKLYHPEKKIVIRNFGVSSETISGLSEPEHPFQRPCLFGRLERILEEVQPDWVIAFYGINDGIYHPFSEERLEAYRKGWNKLERRIHKTGAKLIAMTPPVFDTNTLLKSGGTLYQDGEDSYSFERPYERYDDVMKRYAMFVKEEVNSDLKVDAYVALREEYGKERILSCNEKPGDGIHPDIFGHLALACFLLKKVFGYSTEQFVKVMEKDEFRFMKFVWERDTLYHKADIECVGHDNPDKAEYLTGAALVEAIGKIEKKMEKYLADHKELKQNTNQ